jgi:O-antigen/teichoic acid export membrane protein
MWPIQIGLAILAPPVIQLLFGAKWIDSALPLSLLMIAQAIVLSFGMNWELFVLRGETRVQRRLEIWRALTGLLAFSAGTQFGMAGAASGRIVEAGMGAILYRGHIDRMAQIARGEANRILGRAALLAIAATAPSLALMIGYRWSSDTPLWSVAAALLAGIVLWGVALRMMRHPLLHELQRLVGPLRDRHQ